MKTTLAVLTIVMLSHEAVAQVEGKVAPEKKRPAATEIAVYKIGPSGPERRIGTVTAKDTQGGLELRVLLRGLPDGEHGFHVHVNPTCASNVVDNQTIVGGAAGPHFDPEKSGRHEGPQGHGHLGDLPLLTAKNTVVDTTLVAPRLRLDAIKGRSLIIQEHGDNYSDRPSPLGGGGARIACAIIK